MSLPAACQDCNREGKQVDLCTIRTYQFQALMKKCPKEKDPNPRESNPREPVLNNRSKTVDPLPTNLKISDLEMGSFSPRMAFDPKYVSQLAGDIEAEGQLKPIMVRLDPEDSRRYQVIDGEHRVRALQKLGKTLVRVEVHALNDEEAYYRAMRINQLHGKRLEGLEEGRHIDRMITLFNFTEAQIGKRFNRSQSWVSERRSLALSIAPKVEKDVISRLITSTHAVEIARLPQDEQTEVAEIVTQKKLSIKATRGIVSAIRKAETVEKKAQILHKPLAVYAQTFKDPKQLEQALLTIGPKDDFIEKTKEIKTETQAKELFDEALSKKAEPVTNERCPHCSKEIRIDWIRRQIIRA